MKGLDVDDLPRRLADLADAAGPWDDPLPEVRRRAAQASAANAGLVADLDVSVDGAPVRPRPAAARAKSRWRSIDPFTIASAAAVVLVVVGLGWLIHGAGAGDSSEKSANSAGTTDFESRAAGSAVPGSSASGGASVGAVPHASSANSASVPAPATTAAAASGCGIAPGGSSGLSLRAPATVRTGAVLSVQVRLTGSLAGSVQSQVVLAVARGLVVGRLVPTGGKVGPGVVPAAVVTGTLRTGSCDLVTPKPGPTPPLTLPGRALAPGRYQLVVVVTSARATTISSAVGVTVTP